MRNDVHQDSLRRLVHEHVLKPVVTVGLAGSLIFGFAYAVAGCPRADSQPIEMPCGKTEISTPHQTAGKYVFLMR